MIPIEIKKGAKSLGQKQITALEDIFKSLEGHPARILRERYRANNPSLMETLDVLEHQQLLKTDDRRQYYWLSVYAIPLFKNEKSTSLIESMNEIFIILKAWYKDHLSAPLAIEEIVRESSRSREETLLALHYIAQAHNIWSGLGQEFPYKENSSITMNEKILLYSRFIDVLGEYWRWQTQRASSFGQPSPVTSTRLSRLIAVIWRDPVVSAVIAAGIVAILAILFK